MGGDQPPATRQKCSTLSYVYCSIRQCLFCALFVVSFSTQASVTANSATFRASDGASLHYLDAGTGQALVLIAGWTMPADIFEPQLAVLSDRFRVVALDPRSQGDSDKTAEGNYPERHAQDIKELLEHLQISCSSAGPTMYPMF